MKISDVIMLVFLVAFIMAPALLIYNSVGKINTAYENDTLNSTLVDAMQASASEATNMVGDSSNPHSLVGILINLNAQADPLTMIYAYFSFFMQATIELGKTLLSFLTAPLVIGNLLVSALESMYNMPPQVLGVVNFVLNIVIGLAYLWLLFKILEMVFGRPI